MKNIYLVLMCLVHLSIHQTFSQSFSVTDILPTEFPKVSAYFSAYNAQGQHFTGLTNEDFIVTDNGLTVPKELVEITCVSDAPVSIVLVIDRSGSMQDEVDGEIKWRWAIDAAKEFIAAMDLGTESQIAITSFAGTANIICPFSRDKKELNDSLNLGINIFGNTNYNVAFLHDITGAIALLKKAPAWHKRAIVFLTDGGHDPQGGNPLQMDKIIQDMNNANIQLFSVTLLSDKSNDLEYMSKMTGGRYVMVGTRQQLKDIYKSYASTISAKIHCQIIWINPDICDTVETFRNVSIRFNILGFTRNRQYLVPFENIVHIDSDLSTVDFGDPDIGYYEERTVTITPRIKSLLAKDIKIVPPGYFKIVDWGNGIGNEPAYDFIMPVDIPRTIKIRFTPQNEKKYRQAALVISGLPCPIEIDLFGGFQRIKLERPEKDDTFSKCDSIHINWSGVTPDTDVDIYYSTDNGRTWRIIARNQRGGSYIWYPNFKAQNIRVKVRVADVFEYKFAKSFGGNNDVVATCIDVSYNNLYVYMTGFFEGNMTIDNKTLTSFGKKDFFIAKFDSDGNLVWARSDGGLQHDEYAYGIAVDEDGNAFVTGVSYAGTRFGSTIPVLDMQNVPYLFLAKYSSNGNFLNVNFLGPIKDFEYFRPVPEKISFYRVYGEQPKVYIQGKYTGRYTDIMINKTLPESTNPAVFTAIFNERLGLIDLRTGVVNTINYNSTIAYDADNNKYETGDFTGNKKIGDFNLTAIGGKDSFLSKFGKIPVSESPSETFHIDQPQLSFSMQSLNFPDCTWGDSLEYEATGFIVNNSKLATFITGYEIYDIGQGDMAKDFELITDIIGTIIQPGEAIDITFKFKPSFLNLRKAILKIIGNCMDDITIELKGNGSCGGIVLDLYDFGEVNLNKTVTDTIFCAFRNHSNYRVFIDPKIRGLNLLDFTLTFPDYITRVNNRVPVDPGVCIDLIISFTPSQMDQREAFINFFVDSPCNNSETQLRGFGISADVRVTSYDFERRRINGNYNGEIFIKNNSNGIEYIDNIRLDDNFGVFTLDIPSLPFSIQPNDEIRIPVRFNPPQEIDYDAEVHITVRSKTTDLIGTLKGSGYLPKLTATWKCGETVLVGQSTIATLIIENPSLSSELKIKEIYFDKQNAEFVWQSGSNPMYIILDTEEMLEIPVIFSPQQGSNHLNTVIILADNYDASFNADWNETRISTECDGINVDFDGSIAFGNKLICNGHENIITITNTSKETDIYIYFSQHRITGSEGFSINQTDDVLIKGGEKFTFKVYFNPEKVGTYNAKLEIPNSAGISMDINLTGTAGELSISAEKTKYTFDPGQLFTYPVFLKLPTISGDELTKLTVKISFDNTVLRYINNSFISTLNTNTNQPEFWVWDKVEYLGFGQLEISGYGRITSQNLFQAFSIQFLALLNDMGQSPIFTTLDYDCYQSVTNLSNVEINEVCFNENRIIITSSAIRFFLSEPTPNPASTEFRINYGIAFETDVKLVIYDIDGNLVMSLVDGKLKQANYEIIINTKDFNSGVYFIRLEAGPYVEVKSIMIAK